MSDYELIENGSIGRFHLLRDDGTLDNEPSTDGWIARHGRRVNIDTIADDRQAVLQRFSDDEAPMPDALLVQLPGTTATVLEISDRGGSAVMTGEGVSTALYSARLVALGTPLGRIRSSRVRSLSAKFLSLGRWAGFARTDESWDYHEDGRVRGYSLRLGSVDGESFDLGGGRQLEVGPSWRVDGPQDDRRVRSTVVAEVASRRAKDAHELVRPLVQIAALLGVLCRGFVAAESSSIRLDVRPDDRKRAGDEQHSCWLGPLMIAPDGIPAAERPDWPMLDLVDLGGVAGLARWVKLYDSHPRAVGPVVAPYRYGPAVIEVDLLSLGAALEYWVAAHRRTAKWAITQRQFPKRTGRHRKILESAVDKVGPEFAQWVGNRDAWCDSFTAMYEGLKHDPAVKLDSALGYDLVTSARYLLFALLADRVAGTRAPSRRIFTDHWLSDVGMRLRTRF
ncbi:MAG: hypothetical protein QNJ12_21735 [Ilumatobacter sp.]|uniref:ApeA N-terminal domain 1-containing protein n=1 Tax=Ilumatobacter sp. TaxID=1967498 RepID=UPI00262180B0|nr:hypothetical protein [Ilumatobacter sp.]MDJ0771423.1 hypothetical protein [Ilumatobacter sp.]